MASSHAGVGVGEGGGRCHVSGCKEQHYTMLPHVWCEALVPLVMMDEAEGCFPKRGVAAIGETLRICNMWCDKPMELSHAYHIHCIL